MSLIQIYTNVINRLARESEALSSRNCVNASVDRNAIAHAYVAAKTALLLNEIVARLLAEGKEYLGIWDAIRNGPVDAFRDFYNNEIGRGT